MDSPLSERGSQNPEPGCHYFMEDHGWASLSSECRWPRCGYPAEPHGPTREALWHYGISSEG